MFEVPIGKARTVREGEDITIITYGTMVNVVEKALEKKPGISAEVLDLRTINPLDEDAIVDAAKKTGKVIIVHEAPMSFGVGAEVSAIIADKAI
ncbi:MAG: transketolase C-terminal domain-containing protein, partial [Methanothrix sp.]